MTFLFLLPLIYTVLGSVIVAIKTAKSCNHSMKIKARDERVCPGIFNFSPSDGLKFSQNEFSNFCTNEFFQRMNALVVSILVGFILCWTPYYTYQVYTDLYVGLFILTLIYFNLINNY